MTNLSVSGRYGPLHRQEIKGAVAAGQLIDLRDPIGPHLFLASGRVS
jgi:hypothetical protein